MRLLRQKFILTGLIMSGGDLVSAYVPDSGIQELLKEHTDFPVWKLRYTSNGSTLYSVCDSGILRRYRRYPDRHEYLGEVYRHKGDIQDLDISPYDECILSLVIHSNSFQKYLKRNILYFRLLQNRKKIKK